MTTCCISGVCDKHMARNDLLADKMATAKSLAAQAEQAVLDMAMVDAIQCLRMLAETATSTLETAILVGRERGMTWDEIGKWLGVTRQAAQQRFGG
jgi:tRNA C32,U32 (ribose-2'-O)-methylase TrmJ